MITMLALSDFARLLAAVRPHLGTDPVYPELTAIRLEITGPELLAIATDRYSLAVARHRLAAPARPIAAHLLAPDADACIERALIDPSLPVVLDLEQTEGDLVLLIGDDDVGLDDRAPDDTRFPDWRRVVQRSLADENHPVGELALNPALLARLTAVRTRRPLADIRFTGTHQQMLVRIEDWFLAMVMPVRQDHAESTVTKRVEDLARDLAARP